MVETAKRAVILGVARPKDLPKLGGLAREFYGASRFLRGFNLDRFCQFWTGMIDAGAGAVFILWEGDAPAGAIGGVTFPDVNSGELIGTEFFWFVSEQSRGFGMVLYGAFEDWCREKGCKQIRMMRLTDSMPALDRIYRRMGFEAAEVLYTKEL